MRTEPLQLALRARLVSLAVCTTGVATIAATATGYTRASGSFLTDGFRAGMELTAAGFGTAANNGTARILSASALELVVDAYDVTATADENGYSIAARTLVVEAGSGDEVLTVGLPACRAWENTRFKPTADIPYCTEQLLGGGSTVQTMGITATLENTPIYVVTLFLPQGTDIAAIRRYSDAIIALFKAGTAIAVGSETARVRGDIAPTTGPILQLEEGRAAQAHTIPLRHQTLNAA
jgi:hypothetical protein